ncbi:LysM peptidoglycan-binding domain-containing protein [Pelosinus sp. sgz500959]|uniref:LysM peptidoglycan-binding domain-containing protein n=1 Tax=Pelosinus sp. sgz500959 TaxID=3242472 RepID=UPI00367311CC
MNRILLAVFLIVFLWSITPLASSNAYLEANCYTTFYVKSGDTVWGVATHYVTARDDIRDLTQAIKQLNGLNNNAHIYPGQVLKVPVK